MIFDEGDLGKPFDEIDRKMVFENRTIFLSDSEKWEYYKEKKDVIYKYILNKVENNIPLDIEDIAIINHYNLKEDKKIRNYIKIWEHKNGKRNSFAERWKKSRLK